MADSDTARVLRESSIPGLPLARRGKVRDVYDLGDAYLLVATDRISAFDCVLPGGIPEKGRVLTQLSLFWFDLLGVRHHVRSDDVAALPEVCRPYEDELRGRVMIVEKLEILPVECIVRGYLSGSGWNEYRERGTVGSIDLPEGLVESSRLPEALFTPSTKAEEGHDENISFTQCVEIVGRERAEDLRDRSVAVYRKASEHALSHGIIIADTKFEWGIDPRSSELVLADEVLTPDSSRFWSADAWGPGGPQASFDKQFVRDWLLASTWNRSPPAPELPEDVVRETSRKYIEIYEKLTGETWA